MSRMPDWESALRTIDELGPKFAAAKARRTWLEEGRKSLKSELMREYAGKGVKALQAQERDAYADPKYQAHLAQLEEAVDEAEALWWKLIGAQLRFEAWRSINANDRAMTRNAQ